MKLRLRRVSARILLAALAGALLLGGVTDALLLNVESASATAAPTSAWATSTAATGVPALNVEACATSYLATSGRELFSVDAVDVPPPLRGFTWDCASRLAGGWPSDEGATHAYVLVFTDAKVATVVDILRSFEQAGWIVGPSIGAIDTGPDTARTDGVALTSADLAAIPTTPEYIRARFGDESTGQDTIELTYTDGTVYTNDVSITSPSIFVTVSTDRQFSASGIGDPSVLSSLRTIDQAMPNPVQLGVLCSFAVILTLVVGYPATLLNSVIGGRYDKVATWLTAKLRGRKPAEPAKPAKHPKTSWLVWPGFVLAAVVAGFVDPEFGPNLMSLRVLITGFLSFALFNLFGWALVRRVVRRLQPDAAPYVRFRWGSLIILLVTVLAGRLLDFRPGVIFGLVAGLAFGVTLLASRKAIVVLVGSGFALALSLLGWVGYSILAPLTAPGNAVMVAVVEFLSGMTLEGIATLPLALLPLAALDGAKLLKWKKWVWGLSYAIGLAAFALVLFTIPESFSTYTGDFLRWSLLFLGFAVAAVLIWWIDAAAKRRAVRKRGQKNPGAAAAV